MINVFVDVLFQAATIHPNPPVTSIHRLTLMVALPATVVIVVLAGVSQVTEGFGFSFGEPRQVVPILVVGLGGAVIALPLLQIPADIANALVEVFRPSGSVSIEELAGLTAGLGLVVVINAFLLAALVILFVFRNVYLLFIAAVSPLVAIGWALPATRPYARSFSSAWFALLATAPADALVLRFSLALLEGPFPDWIWGVASFSLMLYIPYQLIAVSQGIVGGRGLAGRIQGSWRRRWPPGGNGGSSGGLSDEELRRQRRNQRRRDRDRGGRW